MSPIDRAVDRDRQVATRKTALDPARFLIVFALFASLGATSVAALYPPTLIVDEVAGGEATVAEGSLIMSVFAVGWIGSQAFLLTIPSIVVGSAVARKWPRLGKGVGAAMAYAVIVVMLCDVVTYHWIGQRFASRAMWRISTSLRGSLAGHVTSTMIVSAVLLSMACAAYASLAWYGATKIANRWSGSERLPRPLTALSACVVVSLVVSSPAIWNADRTLEEMSLHSSRHPFCAFRLVAHRGVGPAPEIEKLRDRSTQQVSAEEMFDAAISARDRDQRRLGVVQLPPGDADSGAPSDVLIVVIESFRHELLCREVMPNLLGFAERGIWCRQHFSGGNATNHGMFSLLNGLEAIWYDREVRYSPILNRLFRQAGYELGFFGGHNDWRKFLMDGYISDAHYDLFETEKPNWLVSDRRATQRAATFLDRRGGQKRRPRLAVLYLYSTHANYHSYAEDRIFQPSADDRFLIPFTAGAKPAIWNRYKNSARSIDRLLAAVMTQDRVVIVTGDHGESFLEDGVCGHGIRISKYQNMTPAVIYCPRREPRVIDFPTMHADLLPTLLAAVGLTTTGPTTTGPTTTGPDVLDGDDLMTISDADLAGRVFATRNYLDDDLAIVGPWTLRKDRPFAFRVSVSLKNSRKRAPPRALNAIDATGAEQVSAGVERGDDRALNRWLKQRFGDF